MTYVVTQPCCADASCVLACPVNCIHPAPGEPGFAEAEMVYIDADTCVGCGACVTACPVGAIVPRTRLTAEQQPFVALAAEYYEVFPHADRTPVALVPRQRRLRDRARPVRVAVVGAGPAGLYTADELLTHPEVAVDVFERQASPHGLARYGVAPDHPHTREVGRLFEQVAAQRGFTYRLGVDVGAPGSPSLADLESAYDAVVFAGGAAADRRLGVPGEHLRGSVSATDLVGWYNGHPDHRRLDVPLDAERAVVIGTGNVALDVARMLTADPEALERTDVDREALAALWGSEVHEVVVLGRRGPADAAFTTPELVGLVGLAGLSGLGSDAGVDVLLEGAVPAGNTVRHRLLADLAARRPTPGRPRIVLRFHAVPEALLGDGRVTGVRLADGTVLAAGLVVRAIGYRGLPVTGLPCDERTGAVVHDRGRVRPGMYVVGWAKRGPTGFLGTNKTCAQETVSALLDDLDEAAPRRTSPASLALLH